MSQTGLGKNCWVRAAAAPQQETGVSWSRKLMWVCQLLYGPGESLTQPKLPFALTSSSVDINYI